jgi:molybdenum cofactor guanylyltransferase
MHANAFAAAVLAGGRSTRMGTDKAALRLADGCTLLARQLELLASLEPAQLIVSARQGQLLPTLPAGITRIDDPGDAGPLGGIVACLRAVTTPRLLVVAVDLPRLEAAPLRALLDSPTPGAVPRVDDHLEPLVALYPRAWLEAGENALQRGNLSLQRLLRQPEAKRLFTVLEIAATEHFLNWNSPHDL